MTSDFWGWGLSVCGPYASGEEADALSTQLVHVGSTTNIVYNSRFVRVIDARGPC